MHRTTLRALGALATALFVAACAERSPLGPNRHMMAEEIEVDAGARGVELGECADIQVPAGNKLASHLYATGLQVYRWTGTAWTLARPDAGLFADAAYTGQVGTHGAGPTWESASGSIVKGEVEIRCNRPGTIQWLRLRAVRADGPGIFDRTTYIQRVNTTGGKAPATAGTTGEVRSIPYTAEYFFYRPL